MLVACGAPAIVRAQGKSVQMQATNGVFIWTDGSWRSVHLPTFSFGSHEFDSLTFADRGTSHAYDPRLTGAGFSGGIGYTLPNAASNGAFGSDLRIGLGVLFVRADGSGSVSSHNPTSVFQLVNGQLASPCGACTLSSQLDSRHEYWRLDLSAASDYRFGSISVTPTLAVVGGRGKTDQTFAQLRAPDTHYNLSSGLKWSDFGGRFGLGVSAALTPAFTLSLTGTVGVVRRSASLDASDTFNDSGLISSSAVSASALKTAVLSGAELRAVFKTIRNVEVHVFTGLDYDSAVPMMTSTSFTPAQMPLGIGTPAGLGFHGEVGYYFGGGLTVGFDF